MWIGLMHVHAGETPDAVDGDLALIGIYRDDGSRLMRLRGPLTAIPEIVRMLRAASAGAPRGLPSCERCEGSLGAPDIDAAVEDDPCAFI